MIRDSQEFMKYREVRVGRLRQLCVALGALLIALGLAYVSAAPAHAATILFDEDFDAVALGGLPSSFSAPSVQTGYAAAVVERDSDDHAFRLDRTGNTTTSSYVTHAFPVGTAPADYSLTVDAMAEQTNSIGFIAQVRGESNLITSLAFYNDGTVRIFTPTGWRSVAEYDTGTWYSFQLDVNATSSTIDVRINDTSVAEGVPFRTAQAELRQWQVGVYFGSGPASLSVDAMSVVEHDVDPSPSAFSETFEDRTVGTYPSTFIAPPTTAGYGAEVDGGDPEQGRYLQIEREGRSTSTYLVAANLDTPLPVAVVAFSARAAQADAVLYATEIRGAGGTIARVAFYNDGTIRAYNGTWVTILDRYVPDRWYDIRVLLDAGTQTFAVAIDDVVVAEDLVFQSAQSAATRVSFGLGVGYRSIGLAVDDIDVFAPDESPLSSVSLPSEPIVVSVGQTVDVGVVTDPVDPGFVSFEWSTQDGGVATIDNGRLSGVTPGTTSVRVDAVDLVAGVTVSGVREVQVVDTAVTGITLGTAELLLPVGSSQPVSATIVPATASDVRVEWTSLDTGVAVVDAAGVVTAVTGGTTTVVATTVDGAYQASVDVQVVEREVADRFFVDSELGDDTGTGSSSDPFATLARASEAVRAATSSGSSMSGDVEVIVRDGVYVLDETLRLDDRDGGDGIYRVIYKAEEGAQPVVSGGRTIEGWQLYDPQSGIYRAPAAGLDTRQLYVDGIRAIRARSEGPLTDAELSEFGVSSSDTAMSSWSDLGSVEFVFRERWTQPRATVSHAELSSDGNTIQFVMDEPGWTAINSKGSTSVTEGPIYIENALELLDDEGEWYSDGQYVYYKPRSFEDLSTAEVVAPVLEQLMLVQGSGLDERVEGLSFDGISFSYTTWLDPSTGWGLPDTQSNHLRYPGEDDWLVDGAVVVTGAVDVDFTGSTFSHLGGSGLQLLDGVQNSEVAANHFFDISGAAINVGRVTMRNPEIYAPLDDRLVMRGLRVEENYIHDIGVDYAAAAAISAGFLVDSDISHNEIFNIPYSGISVGYGVYNFVSTGQRDVRVESNYIHDLMGDGVNDGGAIYTVGYTGASQEAMNSVHRNYLQNQEDKWSVLYADNASNYWAFTQNVIDQTDTPVWDDFPAYWAFGKEADLVFDENYTTTPYVNTSFSAAFPVTNTHVVPDAEWPIAAQQIIDESGVGSDVRAAFGLGVDRLHVEPVIALGQGESRQIEMEASREKGQAADFSDVAISYRSLDESVATVSSSGEVEAVGRGVAVVETRVVFDELEWVFTTQVYVDDDVETLEFRNVLASGRTMIVGENLEVDVYGLSDLGREVQLDDIVVESSDELVVDVLAEGSLSALAEGDTVVTFSSASAGISRTLDVGVVTRSSDAGLAVPATPFDDALADEDGWTVTSGSIDFDAGSVQLATPSGLASYVAEQYQDELLTFDMTIEGESGWEAIEIRNQSPSTALDTAYVVVVKPNEIELHRFNGGTRTVLFGAVTGFTSVGGPAYPNDVLPFGETRQIQIGAINEEDGVRIVLNVDGHNVFYFLDTGEDRILEPGYFSVMARYWTVVLSPSETIAPAPGEVPGAATLSTTSGWASGLQDGYFDVVMDLWWGVPGDELQLYENDALIATVELNSSGTSQHATIPIGGRPDGQYVYSGVLSNAAGGTPTGRISVAVTDAGPATPALRVLEWEGADRTLMTDLWWGTNASQYRLCDNDELVDEQMLTASTPGAQHVESALADLSTGRHEFRSQLINAFGESWSTTLVVDIAG